MLCLMSFANVISFEILEFVESLEMGGNKSSIEWSKRSDAMIYLMAITSIVHGEL